jgi:hypothetical protein
VLDFPKSFCHAHQSGQTATPPPLTGIEQGISALYDEASDGFLNIDVLSGGSVRIRMLNIMFTEEILYLKEPLGPSAKKLPPRKVLQMINMLSFIMRRRYPLAKFWSRKLPTIYPVSRDTQLKAVLLGINPIIRCR